MTRWIRAAEVQARYFTDAQGRATASIEWIHANVPRVRLSPRKIVFDPDEVELFIASRRAAA